MAKKKLHPKPSELREKSVPLGKILFGEDDFQCAIIAASYIDSCLASLLQSYLIEGHTSAQLLDYGGTLGEMGARAKLAYCLGLIPKETLQDINTIGEIRNIFAHDVTVRKFTDEDITAKCGSLIPFSETKTDPRTRFVLAASLASAGLIIVAEKIQRSMLQEQLWVRFAKEVRGAVT